MNANLIKLELDQFFGSEKMYKCKLTNTLYTEGVKYLADRCEAWWLVSDTLIQAKSFTDEGFILIRLIKNTEDKGCVITYENGNGIILKSTMISYTDFPLDKIKLYFIDNTLLLPGEY